MFVSSSAQKANELAEMGLKSLKVKSKTHTPMYVFPKPKLPGPASLTLKLSKEGSPFYQLNPFGSQPSSSAMGQHHPKSGASSGGAVDGAADGDKRKEYLGCDWLHEVSITIRKVKTTPMPLEE